MEVTDKAVLVTGANRGLGKALVEEILRRGAKRVYAGARKPLAHADQRITPLILDVTDTAQIGAAVERIGSLDILINNAGIGLYDDLGDRAALERHLAVNLLGVHGVTHACCRCSRVRAAPWSTSCRKRPSFPSRLFRPTRCRRPPRSP
ncbi:SDR family NAD(P)-dependent oxidoreductase [Mesorhizobium sp. M0028]